VAAWRSQRAAASGFEALAALYMDKEVKDMTKHIEGQIERIIEKQAAQGGTFRVVRIDGDGYFDWNGHVAEAGVKEGDTVKLRVSDDQYPKVQGIEKLGDGGHEIAPQNNGKTNGRDLPIARMSCLRSAAELLADLDEPPEKRQSKVIAMAAEMEKWVTNGSDEDA